MIYGEPQWSPPLIGGSTPEEAEKADADLKAAMEPAVDRREHGDSRVCPNCAANAAMEPAVDRREHQFAGYGGAGEMGAAMEPAVDRREHGQARALHPHRYPAAMEPAVDRREHKHATLASRRCPWRRNGARR